MKPTLATTVGIILWLSSYYFFFVPLEKNYQSSSFMDKITVALIPNMALHLAIKVMSAFEGKAVGAHWSNIAEPISSVDPLALGHVILMFLLNTCMYMFLAVYVENVLPSEYGVRKPWYYIFQPSTYRRRGGGIKSRPGTSSEPVEFDNNMPGFETQPSDINVGVEIKNLRKVFGRNKAAVNGAGKTTTISMLTGLFAPSGGTATVNGYDITTELDMVRDNLGLCPQHNMLFDKLTVSEHLRFFWTGLTSSEATKEMKELLKKLQLSEKNQPYRGHCQGEADVLGDRIGIMAAGKLVCCGTSMYLKKFYGTGYTLKLSISENEQRNTILTVIQKYVPNASIKASHSTNTTELLITLPTETASTSILSEMFIELTRSKQELGIKTMGLSLTTMDEVFLRVGELTDEHLANETSRSSAEGTPEAFHKVLDERMTLKNGQGRLEGLKLVKEQFLALLTKKYIYTLRKRKLMLSQLIIPVVILILAIWVSNKSFETPEPPPALEIKLDSYKKPVTLASSTDPTFSAQLASVIGASYKQVPNGGSVLTAISDLGVSDLAAYRETHIIAAEVNSTNFNALFNSIPNHAAPLAINIASNTLLKNLDPNNNFRINVKNHPLQSKMDALLEAAKPDPIFTQTIPFMFAVFMPIGLALLAASFVVFPLEEKLCNAKQLQMMTGVSPLSYWYSAFLWDFFLVFLVVCVMTACFPIFQSYSVFTSYGGAGVVFLILLVYGYSAISFSYLISLYSSTVAGGFALVSIIHIVSGMILCLLVHLMEIGDLLTMAGKVRWVGRLFPTFGASINTMRFSEIASNNGRCNILSDEARSLICDINIKTIPSEYRECCENCVELESKCFKPTPYITWEYTKHGLEMTLLRRALDKNYCTWY
ncbi:ATP-binding cassette sub-family A member 3 [Orchesella cincta]|uniref:ATP-binding cassette sub-family A member 3 n=1 Tax=Orchesella cincta TaxID=48709 RepID=A0A1D2MWH2_ORCCI|nr:ATP-binding cassette sub-family A member 3 [Orchesella cincta]